MPQALFGFLTALNHTLSLVSPALAGCYCQRYFVDTYAWVLVKSGVSARLSKRSIR